ncbi:topoisomerase, partial [Salmonella enterica]|nr:topoisomerase [Salmonella enterica]
GCWHDFATGDSGGDPVSLLAYLMNVRQYDAARMVADRMGLVIPALGKPDLLTPEQRHAQRERLEAAEREAQRLRDAESRQRQREQKLTACHAFDLMNNAGQPDPHHPYLARKRLQPFGLYQSGRDLLVPLYNIRGELVNIQTIGPDGRKLFLRHGQVQGAFHIVGDFDLMAPDAPPYEVYICEGWATGAALYQGWNVRAVACAMNAGNLKHVAAALRGRYGSAIQLVIAADDDRTSKDNPGMKAASVAALLVGCMMTAPDWPPGAPENLSDFNDLMLWEMEHEQ